MPLVESRDASNTNVPTDMVAVPVFLTWNTTLEAAETSALTVALTAAAAPTTVGSTSGQMEALSLPDAFHASNMS